MFCTETVAQDFLYTLLYPIGRKDDFHSRTSSLCSLRVSVKTSCMKKLVHCF